MKQLLALIALISLSACGQNLVPNESFEEMTTCPVEINNDGYLSTIKNWKQPTTGTSDYYNKCCKGIAGVPKNGLGYMPAKDGNAYAGIYVYDEVDGHDYREYLQCKLLQSLKKDKQYCVKYYVAVCLVTGEAIDDMGSYFSADAVASKRERTLKVKPQVSNPEGNMLDSPFTWMPVGKVYTAFGGEQYLTIGNFKRNEDTHIRYVRDIINSMANGIAYYYIDDVSVVEIKDSSECDCKTKYRADVPLNIQKRYIHFHPKPKSKPHKDSLKVISTYVLQDIGFDVDKSELNSSAYPVLDKVVKVLQGNDHIVEISGYTDSTGTEEHNQQLSTERAVAVKNYFLQKGIKPERVISSGYGSGDPVATNATDEGRKKNRRVEIKELEKNKL